uniref:Coiled-coil domain-containing protein 157 n=1 Tax=Anas zonorhyncha TaxID=75864 RepID=A0A8B9VMK8_9AVES
MSPSFAPLGLSLTDCLQPAWFDLCSVFCSVLSPPEKGFAQASLREVGEAITSICQSHNIPSALSRFQQVVAETVGKKMLSAAEVKCWASEQSKDLSRISKHLHTLLELAPKGTTRAGSSSPSCPAGLHGAVASPEMTKKSLLEDLKTTMVARSRVLELEEEVRLLTDQKESLGQELSAVTTQLEKEKAKVESMLRHRESLQAKQNALLQQLDSLDQEREELQASLGEAEGDRARLAEQLEESREQREQSGLEQSVSKLREDVSRLEEQAQELKEREKLLVFFPELHVPVETQFESKGEAGLGTSEQAAGGTGNIAEDMEKQLQANDIRIGVLEQENTRLRAALAKLKVAAQQGVLQVRLSPSWGWELAGEGHTCWGGTACPQRPRSPSTELNAGGFTPIFSPPARPTAPAVDSAQQPAWWGGRRVSRNPEEGAGELPTPSSPPTSSASPLRRPPSSQGSGDGAGARGGATSRAWQRPPGSQRPKPPSAEPTSEAGPCLSLPARGLLLAPDPRGSSSNAGGARPFSHRTGAHRK